MRMPNTPKEANEGVGRFLKNPFFKFFAYFTTCSCYFKK